MGHPSDARASQGIGRQTRFLALSAIGFAACAAWQGSEAFTPSAPHDRLASHLVVEKLPRGLVCREGFRGFKKYDKFAGIRRSGVKIMEDGRPEWNPLPQWRGEKSWHPKQALQADENRQWYHFDAEGKTLGHLCQAIAKTLIGKASPLYDPVADVGAFVIVTNCERVRVSGKKYHYKLYFRNLSKRPGHMHVERFKDIQKRFPERIIMKAVWGSMAKTRSNKRIFKDRLKLFTGPNHLYYDKNPIEYPMHKIKDCTPSTNINQRFRITEMAKRMPQEKAKEAAAKAKRDEFALKKFKRLLKMQLRLDTNEFGQEEAERIEMDALAKKAERSRFQKKRDDWEGIPTPRETVKTYLGLNLPKIKVVERSPRVR